MAAARDIHAPYPGLRPFQSHESEIFFGREHHTDRLLEILQRERFLGVIGPSGCGKSSLVRAGLLPALAAGWLATGSAWRIAILRPGGRPFRRLAESLLHQDALGPELAEPAWHAGSGVITAGEPLPADVGSLAVGRVEAELRRGPLGLVHLTDDVRKLAQDDPDFNLLLLVDQFEELFTYANPQSKEAGAAEAFVDVLLASRADRRARIHVVITMRTDFLGHCVRFIDLPEAINRAQFLIPRLKRAELADAIIGPAGLFGGRVDPTLAEELVNSVSGAQDELPILQHVLNRMWDLARAHDEEAPSIGWQEYNAAGGVTEALSQHANAIYESLPADERGLAEALFKCITERRSAAEGGQEVRRPQTLGHIGDATQVSWPRLAPVVERFAAEGVHFLYPIESPAVPESIVDISHEALIRQWKRLRGWVREEAERAADYRRWRGRAVDRGSGGELLAGTDLARAIEWRDGTKSSSGVASAWRPTAAWARRYADRNGDAASEFDMVLGFIAASEEAERLKMEESRTATERQQQLDRERLEALSQQKAEAENYARQYFEQKLHAEHLARLAEERAAEALARQIATEALQCFGDDPDRGQLLAVLAYETAALPATELVLRQAFVRGEGLTRVLRGHAGPVQRGAFTRDGRRVVTIGRDCTVRVWDAATGAPVTTLRGHTGSVVSAVPSADSRRILTASADGSARLWDADTGDLRLNLDTHRRPVLHAVFGADGTSLLTAARDSRVRCWDAETGALLKTLESDASPFHQSAVVIGAFSPDGATILTASFDRTARLWNARTHELLMILRGHEGSISHATFDGSGTRVATASEDQTARLWDAVSGNPIATLSGHTGALTHVAFSPDRTRLVTASRDGTARIWDVADGRQLAVLRGRDESAPPGDERVDAVSHVAFSPDGALIATASEDETARIWNARSGEELKVLKRHSDAVSLVAFSPDAAQLLTISWDRTATLWNTTTGDMAAALRGHRSQVTDAAFSPDGFIIATGGDDGMIRLDGRLGTLHAAFAGHGKKISRVVFAPSGRVLLTTSYDGTARLWEIPGGRLLHTLEGHADAILDGSFSPDGAVVLTTSRDNSARLWDATSGECLVVLGAPQPSITPKPATATSATFSDNGQFVVWATDDGPASLSRVTTDGLLTVTIEHRDVSHAEFSPDATAVITTGDDGAARIWRTSDGAAISVLEESEGGIVRASFSADGSLAVCASVDGSVRLWEPQDDAPLQSPAATLSAKPTADRWAARAAQPIVNVPGQKSPAAAAMSPDNTTLVTAAPDGAIQLWEALTGQRVGTLTGHSEAVLHIAFTADGTTLLTTSHDGTARLWQTHAGRPIATLAHRGGRLHSAQFSPNGSRILTTAQDHTPRLWDAATFKPAAELVGHDAPISAASFSADSSCVLTTSADGTARLWETTSAQTLQTFSGTTHAADVGIVNSIAYSPDGRSIMTAGEEGVVHIWDANTATALRSWHCHEDAILDARFDPEGRLIATTSKDGTARLWDAMDGRPLAVLAEHSGAVVSAAFSPDGSTFATAGEDRTARLWRLPRHSSSPGEGESGPLHVLRGHSARLVQVMFSPDGDSVITASGDGTARLWHCATGRPRAILAGHQGRITRLAFSPDGTRIATASTDCTARMWDATTGDLIATLSVREKPVTYVDFSPDGTLLLTANQDGAIHLWQGSTGEFVRSLEGDKAAAVEGHQAAVVKAVFSKSGGKILSGSHDRTARLWDVQSGLSQIVLTGHDDRLLDVALSPDEGRAVTCSLDGTTRLWNVSTGSAIATMGRQARRRMLLGRVSRDGSTLLTADSRTIGVWDTSTARRLASFGDGSTRIRATAFSPNGKTAVTGSSVGAVRVWDLEAGACVRQFDAREHETNDGTVARTGSVDEQPTVAPGAAAVGQICFSADGRLAATLAGPRVSVWDATTWELLADLKGHEDQIVFMAFSPDGLRIATASADKTTRLWETATGRSTVTLRGHANAVTHVAFHPDGRTIATAGSDHNALIWDVKTGRMLMALRGHAGPVTVVDFSPDGTRLITAGHDGTAKVWNCLACSPPDTLAALIRTRIDRSLTAEERIQSGI